MHARVSFYDMAGASKEDAARGFEGARSAVEQMRGNQGAVFLVSSSGDKAISVTFWESEDALRESSQQADQAREQAASSAGMTIREVEPYEVAVQFGSAGTGAILPGP